MECLLGFWKALHCHIELRAKTCTVLGSSWRASFSIIDRDTNSGGTKFCLSIVAENWWSNSR